jgi:excinuclease UvrABC ATPase subunit
MTAVEYIQKEFLKKLTDENYDISFDKIIKQAKAMENQYKANIIRAIADYMYSECCSCCEGKDHKDHAEKIAKLLDVPKYEDGSGYNFYQFRNK